MTSRSVITSGDPHHYASPVRSTIGARELEPASPISKRNGYPGVNSRRVAVTYGVARVTIGQGLWIVFLASIGGIATMKNAVLIALALTTLVGSPTLAADLSRPAPAYKAPLPPPAPIFTWTGFYLGGNLGGAWAQRDITDSLYGLTWGSGSSNAVFIGGGQAGFNYQFGRFVLGVEGDFDWAANSHNSAAIVIPKVGSGDLIRITSNNSWITTLAARLGVAFNNVLLYGKAGGGWVGNNGFAVTDLTTGTSITGSNNNTRSGWLAGAGVEWPSRITGL